MSRACQWRTCHLGMLAMILAAGFQSAAKGASPNEIAGAARPVPFVPDPLSVTRSGPAWRYPQSGWIVVHVEGAPYERGWQHGQLLAAEIADMIQSLATVRSPKAPSNAWRDLRLLVDALFLRRFDEEYLHEMKGIADGAAAAGARFDGRRIDLVDIAVLNCDIEISTLDDGLRAAPNGLERTRFREPQVSPPRGESAEHCSAFVAAPPAAAAGQIVLGHITMSSLSFVRHVNVWLDLAPDKGHRLVMQTFPGGVYSGQDYYISAAGMIVAETTIQQTRFEPAGETLASRIRRAVQYGDSIDSVVEILSRQGNGLYTNQWQLADIKTGEIALFELGTRQTRLWRSSRQEWPTSTAGFYLGCNRSIDREVLKETVADLGGKPANLVSHPRSRDGAWHELFERRRGKIDEAFGFEAFGMPPLVGFPSCDAKFTTQALARDLSSWALFGPPLGRTWDPSNADRRKDPQVRPLVSNDWTLLSVAPPPAAPAAALAADLTPFPEVDPEPGVKFDSVHPFAWRGTLLPQSDADVWLAAAFAEFEKVVSYEKALKRESKKGEMTEASRDAAGLAQFMHTSNWLCAAQRLGRDLPLNEIRTDQADSAWFHIAVGKGVVLLAQLRRELGEAPFEALMDEFGQAHAGEEVSTAMFLEHLARKAGPQIAQRCEQAIRYEASAPGELDPFNIFSFESEPFRTLIVYGTLADRAAQREAAPILQREIARRFRNIDVPTKSDIDVTEDELKSNHIVLIGRPATNSVAARMVSSLDVTFGPASFSVRGKTYARAESAVIAAGKNPLSNRFSVVVFAGLSATATWNLVHDLTEFEDPLPQVFVRPARHAPLKFHLAREPELLPPK
jgi:Phospholipase B